jgi:hypothetical protein
VWATPAEVAVALVLVLVWLQDTLRSDATVRGRKSSMLEDGPGFYLLPIWMLGLDLSGRAPEKRQQLPSAKPR